MALTPEILEAYRLEVQATNKRLQRLERLSTQSGFEGAKNWAYRSAMSDIKALRGASARRFPSAPKQIPSDPLARAKIETLIRMSRKAMERFREMPTSTKTGIKQSYKNRAESFSKGAGVEFTPDDLAGVFESGLWQMLRSAGFGSETTRRVIGEIADNREDLQKLRDQKRAMRLSSESEYGDRLNEVIAGNRSAARVLGKYLDSIK
jgi:hypothetical protein